MEPSQPSGLALVSRLSRQSKLALFLKYAPPHARILEVGSGDGWFTRRLRGHGMTVVSLDLIPPAD